MFRFSFLSSSFLCALSVAAKFEQAFKKSLILENIFPRDSKGRPSYNPSGKYVFKVKRMKERKKSELNERKKQNERQRCVSTSWITNDDVIAPHSSDLMTPLMLFGGVKSFFSLFGNFSFFLFCFRCFGTELREK